MAWLREALAKKVKEVDFFRGALQRKSRSDTPQRREWRDGIYDQIRGMMQLQGNLSIESLCGLAMVSRAGFYRQLTDAAPQPEEMQVRSAIQESRWHTSGGMGIGVLRRSCVPVAWQ